MWTVVPSSYEALAEAAVDHVSIGQVASQIAMWDLKSMDDKGAKFTVSLPVCYVELTPGQLHAHGLRVVKCPHCTGFVECTECDDSGWLLERNV